MAREPISMEQLACSEQDAGRLIQQNWDTISASVSECAERSGRQSSDVTIVGVTKYVDVAITRMLVDAGCRQLGENRPQALWQKAESLNASHPSEDAPIRWHQIGHVQRNKVRRLLASRPLIHTADSVRILDELQTQSVAQDQTIDALVEINISGEEAKTGLSPDDLPGLIEQWQRLRDSPSSSSSHHQSGIQLRGLMAMAGWGTEPDQAQKQFAKLRDLRDRTATQTGVALPELSMGMSGDFQAAIAEGATIVRIGSSLFQGVLP